MTRLLLSGLLCLSFVVAQGHVLRVRSLDSQGRLQASSGLTHHHSAPRPDHHGQSTTRALWKHLSFHWQAQPREGALVPAQSLAAGGPTERAAPDLGQRSLGLILRV